MGNKKERVLNDKKRDKDKKKYREEIAQILFLRAQFSELLYTCFCFQHNHQLLVTGKCFKSDFSMKCHLWKHKLPVN